MVLVYLETGGVPVVHRAWYYPPYKLTENGLALECREEWAGWWSYTRFSMPQERLDGWRTPSHWAPWNGPQEGGR